MTTGNKFGLPLFYQRDRLVHFKTEHRAMLAVYVQRKKHLRYNTPWAAVLRGRCKNPTGTQCSIKSTQGHSATTSYEKLESKYVNSLIIPIHEDTSGN